MEIVEFKSFLEWKYLLKIISLSCVIMTLSIFLRSILSRSKAFKAELSLNSDTFELLLEDEEVGSAEDRPDPDVEDTNIEGKGRCGRPRPKVCIESPSDSKVIVPAGSCLSFLGKLCTMLGVSALILRPADALCTTLGIEPPALWCGNDIVLGEAGGRGIFTLHLSDTL